MTREPDDSIMDTATAGRLQLDKLVRSVDASYARAMSMVPPGSVPRLPSIDLDLVQRYDPAHETNMTLVEVKAILERQAEEAAITREIAERAESSASTSLRWTRVGTVAVVLAVVFSFVALLR